ncbi:MAG: NAD(P)/FAD-dependent oxidoreductase [Burkholderiaceae bacterium]
MDVEFAVIGGSYAGLSAALQLARARRDVAVVDACRRRNRFVSASHGFLGQDGRPPGEIVADAREQLLAYPNVRWIEGEAQNATRRDDGRFQFSIYTDTLVARRVILAIGVKDTLPDVPGLQERWGRSVFHCPYCHGYELDAGEIGIIAASALAQHHGIMLSDWGKTTLFLNGQYAPNDEERAALLRRGTRIEATPVKEIAGHAEVVLVDGRRLSMNGLFTQPKVSLSSPIAEQLGCDFEEGPMGPYIRVNAMQETNVPNLFACGDAARAAGNVALSVADGAMAGVSAHRTSMFGPVGH